ncbi:MAG: PsiF family protein [Betaproteobacteria bacterium]|jgi:hypothetical protein|nr:hypothetical protein [Rhodocyclaceae bacterium]MCA3142562.1 hypothetical protein [Rhodocyclaceae bacterium]MCE2897375.1 PsiF family protein [Betaproteobacteria bacterium]
MHRTIAGPLAATLLATMVCMPTQAADTNRPKRQDSVSHCRQIANEERLMGEIRKRFLDTCLKGQAPTVADPSKLSPQERSAVCTQDASAMALKGEEQAKFMQDCMNG